jgi:hypothetical protein
MIRRDVLEAVRDNHVFVPDCVTHDLKLENAIITALKMYWKSNGKAWELINPKWFTDYNLTKQFEEMKKVTPKNGKIYCTMKDLIWKLSRYYVCRLCSQAGVAYFDWRTITVEYQKYLSKPLVQEIMEFEKKYEALESTHNHRQINKEIGELTHYELFITKFYTHNDIRIFGDVKYEYIEEVTNGKHL